MHDFWCENDRTLQVARAHDQHKHRTMSDDAMTLMHSTFGKWK
jgi:hypothetical protein